MANRHTHGFTTNQIYIIITSRIHNSFKSSLHAELRLSGGVFRLEKDILAVTIEGVTHVVKGHKVRVTVNNRWGLSREEKTK